MLKKKKHAESLQRVLVPFRVTVGKQDSQTARRDKDFMVRSGASQTLQYAFLCTLKCVGTNGDKQEVVNWKVSFYHASINSILNVNMNIFMVPCTIHSTDSQNPLHVQSRIAFITEIHLMNRYWRK